MGIQRGRDQAKPIEDIAAGGANDFGVWSEQANLAPHTQAREFKVAVIPGDGIGPEITDCAVRVMEAAARKFEFKLGHASGLAAAAAVDAGMQPLPDGTLKLCQESDAILCGPFGDPRWDNAPPAERPERAKLILRKTFDLFANLRPVKPVPALIEASPLRRELIEGADILIVRELVSGLYFGEPRGYFEDAKGRYGVNTMKYHAWEVERAGKVAFEAARLRRKRVDSADKANALEVMQLWRETMQKLHDAHYTDIKLGHIFIDNCCMQLVARPRDFDVIVAGNMFGDILSDIGAQITGSLGMLPSASLGTGVPLFEPVHGSAPDIAKQGKANALEVMQLWRETMQKLHDAHYTDVKLGHIFIDNCCMQLVARPKDFDVIVAGNMFGDILSDIGAQITGSLGMLPSASLGTGVPLFEPVHGSAPDIAKQGKANPLAMILTAGMLFTYSAKRPDIGAAIDSAVEKALQQGLRTADIARGKPGEKLVGTKEMGEAVLAAL